MSDSNEEKVNRRDFLTKSAIIGGGAALAFSGTKVADAGTLPGLSAYHVYLYSEAWMKGGDVHYPEGGPVKLKDIEASFLLNGAFSNTLKFHKDVNYVLNTFQGGNVRIWGSRAREALTDLYKHLVSQGDKPGAVQSRIYKILSPQDNEEAIEGLISGKYSDGNLDNGEMVKGFFGTYPILLDIVSKANKYPRIKINVHARLPNGKEKYIGQLSLSDAETIIKGAGRAAYFLAQGGYKPELNKGEAREIRELPISKSRPLINRLNGGDFPTVLGINALYYGNYGGQKIDKLILSNNKSASSLENSLNTD